MRHAASLLLLTLLLGPLAGCRAVAGVFDRSEHPLSDIERETADANLDYAEQEIEAGALPRAVERLVRVREVPNLPPETRLRSEALIDRAASLMLAVGDEDVDLLEDLWDLDLSPRMRARAGVRYAERLFETDHPVKAYKQIKEVEETLPNHPERARAGALLARTGLELIETPGRYYLVLSYAARGAAALEFLVLTYPLDPACDRAYQALARYYEDEGEVELAIARNQDLIVYNPRSPIAVEAAAEIPRLRLALIDEPDHDRGEAQQALDEVEAWLQRHPEHALAPEVQALEARCRRRLAESDLVLSRYYDRIGNPFGARMHAERAAVEAEEAGAKDAVKEARELLDALGPAPGSTPEPIEELPEDSSGAAEAP